MKTKHRALAALAVVPLILLISGCLATRKFVRNSQAPQDTRIQTVEQKSAQNTQAIKDLDEKTEASITEAQRNAEQGIQSARQAATQADEHAQAANQTAERGVAAANHAQAMINNLQNYRAERHTVVTFGLNRSELTPAAQQALDEIATAVGSTKLYVIQVVGHTDNTGPVQYNQALSQRRAEAVVRYLAIQHKIPVVQLHSVGYGEDVPAASNDTRQGREENRRVEITILVPQTESETALAGPTAGSGN